MINFNRPTRLNRALLALIGIVLLAAGGFALATHLGWLRVLDPAAPLVHLQRPAQPEGHGGRTPAGSSCASPSAYSPWPP